MTQYVYLVKKQSANTLEIVGGAFEPKMSPVLDFLDQLAESIGANADNPLSLSDIGGHRMINGRLLPASKISPDILRDVFHHSSSAGRALIACFQTLSSQPEAIFDRAPGGKQNWDIVREFLELRTLFVQARTKHGRYIALCHD